MFSSLFISKRYLFLTSRALNSSKAPNPFEQLMRQSPSTTSKKPNRFSLQYEKSSQTSQNRNEGNRSFNGQRKYPPGAQNESQGKGFGQSQGQRDRPRSIDREPRRDWKGASENNSRNGNRSSYNNRNGYSERAGRTGGNGSYGSSRQGGDRHRAPMRFENHTGSAKAQEALKQMILKVYEANTGFKVNYRNSEGKLELVHLLQITNNLDLNEEGISILNSLFDVNLPIIKKISAKVMLQLYSDELAAQVEDRLLASGSAHAKKVVDSRLKVERKKSAIKMVNLAWTISISDMQNQKRKEIEKRIMAGEKFSIVIGEKSSISKRKKMLKEVGEENEDLEGVEEVYSSGLNHLNDEEYELEIQKRERLFETVESILAEHRCRNNVSGSLERQMFVTVEPIKVVSQEPEKLNKKEELSAKELRRLRRLEKAKGSEPGSSGEDLDAMYLFKIHD